MTDYFQRGSSAKLWVNRQDRMSGDRAPREEMPIKVYFRDMNSMPELEWRALQQCRGSILDIGAGAGSHALALQQLGQETTALDISPLLARLMEQRGVKQVIRQNFFDLDAGNYDTLLLLMNGIGLSGTLDGLKVFFRKARKLLRPGGQLIFDSSDIAYLYGGKPPRTDQYYGQVIYQYEFKRQQSDWFEWLFIDRITLTGLAAQEGWTTEILFEDRHDQYLARCRIR